jgi:hypothetical protein
VVEEGVVVVNRLEQIVTALATLDGRVFYSVT